MKLYYMKGACSLASIISLLEAGQAFEAVQVDHTTHKAEDGESLSAINPKGYVPVLRLDQGDTLTENVAVLEYIADLNPAAKLAPLPGTFDRYRLVSYLAYINSEIHKNFAPLFNPSSEEVVKKRSYANLDKRFDWLNESLGKKPFLTGEQFTVADAYLFVTLSWAPRVSLDLSRWPGLQSHYARVGARPQVIKAQKMEGLKPA